MLVPSLEPNLSKLAECLSREELRFYGCDLMLGMSNLGMREQDWTFFCFCPPSRTAMEAKAFRKNSDPPMYYVSSHIFWPSSAN